MALRLSAALFVFSMAERHVAAGSESAACELRIQGHSIRQLLLFETTRMVGVPVENPGESIRLSAGEYRVEHVELEGGYTLNPRAGQRRDSIKVTPEGPNEIVVGAPLYPTASVRRHGGFLQLDYDTVDGAGRSYIKRSTGLGLPPPPTFTVYQGREAIGSGSFEYG
jgi:hypothetical protein